MASCRTQRRDEFGHCLLRFAGERGCEVAEFFSQFHFEEEMTGDWKFQTKTAINLMVAVFVLNFALPNNLLIPLGIIHLALQACSVFQRLLLFHLWIVQTQKARSDFCQ